MTKTEVTLVILSPTAAVNNLTFRSIPTTITVGDLRERIAVTAATHPAPHRQRLIYRGHALIDAKKTLQEVFTQDTIETSDTLSIHLVLPPEVSAPPSVPPVLSSPPNHAQRSRTPQHEQSRLDPGPGSHHPPHALQTQPQRQANPGSEPSHMQPLAAPHSGNLPPHLQQAFAQFQAVNQQLAAQLASTGISQGFPGMPPPPAGQTQPTSQQGNFMPPSVQQSILSQHQQMQHQIQLQQQLLHQQLEQSRSAGAQNGAGAVPQHTPNIPVIAQDGVPSRSATPGNANTVIRENHGPNGERWGMIIQTGQLNMHPNQLPNSNANPTAGPHIMGGGPPQGPTVLPNVNPQQSSNPSIALSHLQSALSAVETTIGLNHTVPESVIERMRDILRNIQGLSPESRSSLSNRLDGLAQRAAQLQEQFQRHLAQGARERATAQRSNQGANASGLYILNSSEGPQALLVSPSGLFSTSFPALGAIGPQLTTQLHTHVVPAQAQTLNPHVPSNAQQQPNTLPAQPVPQQQAAQAAQEQQANQLRDMLRILLPLGGHLWLLIRLFGFVYFFTAGAGWRRTALLGLVASLVFIAQTEIFRPLIQAVWDPLRRHAEGLVPLAGNERRRNMPAEAAAVAVTDRAPLPQEAAQRLLLNRERQDMNIIRQTLQKIERAIALFVASLVPGVGERHIAAREAAAREVESREREEQARREEEATRERQLQGQERDASNADEESRATAPPGQGIDTNTGPLIEV